MKPTTVISVRGRKPTELLADPNFVYCGRAMPRQGWQRSIWANPFKPGNKSKCGAIDESVELLATFNFIQGVSYTGWRARRPYAEYVAEADHAVCLHRFCKHLLETGLFDRVNELQGKTLGCWCGEWQPGEPDIHCHAVILAKLANGVNGGDPGFSP